MRGRLTSLAVMGALWAGAAGAQTSPPPEPSEPRAAASDAPADEPAARAQDWELLAGAVRPPAADEDPETLPPLELPPPRAEDFDQRGPGCRIARGLSCTTGDVRQRPSEREPIVDLFGRRR